MPLTRNGGAKVVFFSGLWRGFEDFFAFQQRFFYFLHQKRLISPFGVAAVGPECIIYEPFFVC